MRHHLATVRILTLIALSLLIISSDLGASGDQCAETARMQIYSNAFASEETGDVVGYELAVEKHNDSTVNARLYVYEGAANDDGIAITGHISGKELTIEGDWAEHQIEFPSKSEIVQTHHVKINGTLDSVWFRGRVTIGSLVTPDTILMKRVNHIWLCRTQTSRS